MKFKSQLLAVSLSAAAFIGAIFTACSTDGTSENTTAPIVETTAATTVTEQTTISSAAETEPTETEPTETTTETEEITVSESNKITITIGDNQAVVTMLDNAAAQNFMEMLPLTLTFEDYNGVEKISYLPEELSLEDAPTSCDPDVGTFAYYAPWGNLSVFYNDFRQSDSLVPLGEFESGIEFFADAQGEFTVTIERS